MTVVAHHCRSCNAIIGWLRTATGKSMPVDFGSIRDDDIPSTIFDPSRHKSHFSTCPQANQHRRTTRSVPP